MLQTFKHFTIANDFSVLFLFGKVVSVNLIRKVESRKADTQFNIFVLNRPMQSVGLVQTKKEKKIEDETISTPTTLWKLWVELLRHVTKKKLPRLIIWYAFFLLLW